MSFDKTTILTNYQGLVGFRVSENPDIVPLPVASTLRLSSSGLYVTDISGIKYDLFEAIKPQDFTHYYDYLSSTYDQTVLDCLNKFWNNKKSVYKTKEILENRVLQQIPECRNDKKNFDGFAYGFKLRPFTSNNVKLEATKFSLHLDAAATFNIYIYNTLQKAPLAVKSITTVADTATSVDLTSAIVYAQDNSIGYGELILLVYGYYNDGHSVTQISAGVFGYSQPLKDESKYANVEAVSFISSAWDWNNITGKYDLPDLSQMSYTCETRGMNIRFKAECDFTQLLVDNKSLFAPIIQKAVAIKLLWDGVSAYDFNSVTESKRTHWKNLAMKYESELYGYSDEKAGFVKGYFERVDMDLSNLDNVCLPCQDMSVKVVKLPY